MKDMQKQAQTQGLTQTAQQVKTETKSGNKIALREATAQDDGLKEIYKILRRPRSRKYMKALATIDVLSQGDEMIIEEMKKRAAASVGADVEGATVADMVFTPADIESFKNSVSGIIAEELRKEEEALREAERRAAIEEELHKEQYGKEDDTLRKAEKRIELEKMRRTHSILAIYAPCAIVGCVIHTIDRAGAILYHHTEAQVANMGVGCIQARNVLRKFSDWSFAEVYESFLVHRNRNGDTIKIIDLEEEAE